VFPTVDAFLALEDDPTTPKVDQSYLHSEGDILLLEAFLNDDPYFFIIAVQTLGSGISILLAVGTPSTGNGNLYCQWELSPSSGNALYILFPTSSSWKHF
nr:hypothetical protein [Tanacetum cinerariifolium]